MEGWTQHEKFALTYDESGRLRSVWVPQPDTLPEGSQKLPGKTEGAGSTKEKP